MTFSSCNIFDDQDTLWVLSPPGCCDHLGQVLKRGEGAGVSHMGRVLV